MKYLLSEIAALCNGRLVGCDQIVESIMTDSRHSFSSAERPLFVAIEGPSRDGHNYVQELVRRGVSAFLVEHEIELSTPQTVGQVIVPSSIEALQVLAADYRRHFQGRIVAVTGSCGKTMVKELMSQLAPKGVRVFRSPKSYNSQIGVPLSILMMEGDEDVAIIEAGISRMNEMGALARIIAPQVGILTAITQAHDENFDSTEQKLSQKLLLFASCDTIVWHSEAAPDAKAWLHEQYANKNMIDAARYDTSVGDTDTATRENRALAVAAWVALGYNADEIMSHMGELKRIDMQFELSEGLGGSIVVRDRSDNDIHSLAIALDYLKSVSGPRSRTLIITQLSPASLPLGEVYTRAASIIGAASVNRTVCIGESMRPYIDMLPEGTEFYSSAESFLAQQSQQSISAQAILVKGNDSAQAEQIFHAVQRRSHTTVLEVNLDAMARNLDSYRSILPSGCKIMVMAKASCYGHGDYEIASLMQTRGVDYLAVAFTDEGITLRRKGITMPIVVLNADADSFALMAANGLEPEIYNFNSLKNFVATIKRAGMSAYPIHLKIDSGMHRLGFRYCDVDPLCDLLEAERQSVKVRSIFSHMATADCLDQDAFTLGQIALYDKISSAIMARLPYRPLRHLAASAAMERFPQARYDMCRLGIGLYGVGSMRGPLSRVSRLVTRIVQVKELESDQTVGYARAGVLNRVTRVATIPIGYADGLDRHLGCGAWSVMVGGRPAPILGRICMDSCMVDVTDIARVNEGDEAVIFGGGQGNSIEDMARALDTIPYEIMTSISQRVKRIYIKE